MSDFYIDPSGPLGYLVDTPKPTGPDNALGKDAFLKLLVAQMKYQNPMDPSDSTEFISQTAQFTLVEKMEQLTTANEDMLAGQLSSTAASLVGKAVQWDPSLSDEADSPGEGTVQGVRLTIDGPVLIVDGWEVPLARVTAFGEVPAVEEEPPVDGTDGTGGSEAIDEVPDTGTTDPVDDGTEPITESVPELEPEPASDPAATAA